MSMFSNNFAILLPKLSHKIKIWGIYTASSPSGWSLLLSVKLKLKLKWLIFENNFLIIEIIFVLYAIISSFFL